MKNVLFIHGGGGGAYEADALLADSLRRELGAEYKLLYPRMPNEADPDVATWTKLIAENLRDTKLLVGHSIGASIIAKGLTEGQFGQDLAGVFLIAAPFWYDHEIWRWKEAELPPDAGARVSAALPIVFFHGREDEVVPVAHVDLYASLFPQAEVQRLDNCNHQLNDDLAEVAAAIRALR